jgi:hypothetical protein
MRSIAVISGAGMSNGEAREDERVAPHAQRQDRELARPAAEPHHHRHANKIDRQDDQRHHERDERNPFRALKAAGDGERDEAVPANVGLEDGGKARCGDAAPLHDRPKRKHERHHHKERDGDGQRDAADVERCEIGFVKRHREEGRKGDEIAELLQPRPKSLVDGIPALQHDPEQHEQKDRDDALQDRNHECEPFEARPLGPMQRMSKRVPQWDRR